MEIGSQLSLTKRQKLEIDATKRKYKENVNLNLDASITNEKAKELLSDMEQFYKLV